LWKRVDFPHDADWASAKLQYADGLLTVEVPKKTELKEEEEEEAAAALAADVEAKRARLEELRKELEETQRGLVEAQRGLRHARMEQAKRVAEERRTLAIEH
jgi:hypothetical protein